MCEELYDYIVFSLLGSDACVRNCMTILYCLC